MSLLSPRLQLKVAQKQILTPGLVQMVTILQLNRLELKEMVTQEIVKNPVLEESTEEAGEEITADIRYRGETGHSISGSMKVAGPSNGFVQVRTAKTGTRTPKAQH